MSRRKQLVASIVPVSILTCNILLSNVKHMPLEDRKKNCMAVIWPHKDNFLLLQCSAKGYIGTGVRDKPYSTYGIYLYIF